MIININDEQRFMIVCYYKSKDREGVLSKTWQIYYEKPGYITEQLNNLQKKSYTIFAVVPCETEKEEKKVRFPSGGEDC